MAHNHTKQQQRTCTTPLIFCTQQATTTPHWIICLRASMAKWSEPLLASKTASSIERSTSLNCDIFPTTADKRKSQWSNNNNSSNERVEIFAVGTAQQAIRRKKFNTKDVRFNLDVLLSLLLLLFLRITNTALIVFGIVPLCCFGFVSATWNENLINLMRWIKILCRFTFW